MTSVGGAFGGLRARIELLFHLAFLQQCRYKGSRVNGHLLGQLIETVLDLVLTLNTLFLHFLVDLLQLFFLLLLELLLLLHVFVLGRASYLQFEFLLYFLISLVFSLGVLFLELSDFIFLLLLVMVFSLPSIISSIFGAMICESRSVDIVCSDENEFMTWFTALQDVAPMSYEFQSRGALLWTRAIYKVSQRAYRKQTTQLNVWLNLFAEARAVTVAAQREIAVPLAPSA